MAKTAKAPDYRAAAEETAQSSKENTNYQTNANRVDQFSPFGSQQWTQTAVRDPVTGNMVPHWEQRTTLDPQSQHALDSQLALTSGRSDIAGGMLDRIRSEFGPTVDYSQFTDKGQGVNADGRIQGGLGGSGDYMGQAGNALMSQFQDRMNPQFQMAQSQMDTTLRNRGIKPGDEAYDNEMAKLRQGQGDQFNQAMYQAQQLQSGEAQRMQGMDSNSMQAFNDAIKQNLGIDLDLSKFADYQRARDVAETQGQRGWSLNEANALASGQQVGMPTMPQYNTAGRSETTDYSGAAGQQYQADVNAANAGNAMTGALLGAATSPFSITGSFT